MAAPIPLVINGIKYSSINEVARVYNRSTATILRYYKQGRLDKLKVRDLNEPLHNARKPVVLRGVEWPSRQVFFHYVLDRASASAYNYLARRADETLGAVVNYYLRSIGSSYFARVALAKRAGIKLRATDKPDSVLLQGDM